MFWHIHTYKLGWRSILYMASAYIPALFSTQISSPVPNTVNVTAKWPSLLQTIFYVLVYSKANQPAHVMCPLNLLALASRKPQELQHLNHRGQGRSQRWAHSQKEADARKIPRCCHCIAKPQRVRQMEREKPWGSSSKGEERVGSSSQPLKGLCPGGEGISGPFKRQKRKILGRRRWIGGILISLWAHGVTFTWNCVPVLIFTMLEHSLKWIVLTHASIQLHLPFLCLY